MSQSHARRGGRKGATGRNRDRSGDEFMGCPYDPTHRVWAINIARHLIQCRRIHPHLASQMAICPHNRSHHVWAAAMEQHLLLCPEYLELQARNGKGNNSGGDTAKLKRDDGHSGTSSGSSNGGGGHEREGASGSGGSGFEFFNLD